MVRDQYTHSLVNFPPPPSSVFGLTMFRCWRVGIHEKYVLAERGLQLAMDIENKCHVCFHAYHV